MTGFNERVRKQVSDLHEQQLFRAPRVVDVKPDGRCCLNGQSLLNFGGNDYLGLAFDPAVTGTLSVGLPAGATASALVTGRSQYHHDLEAALAAFEDTEAALLFPTGYSANLGVLTGLVQVGDAVFCDHDNHASLIDASRLCAGEFLVYRRDRLDKLRQTLSRRRGSYDHVFLVTDGVFSMDGTIAPLQELCDLAEQFDASIIVDEAHGTGVLGRHGRGAADYLEVDQRITVRIGTMSKAMGGLGGFAAASQPIIDLLRNTARTQFFSTALPPGLCHAMTQSLRIIREQPERRQHLCTLREAADACMTSLGLKSVSSGLAPIVPVLISGENEVLQIAAQLIEQGMLIPAIRSPTVRRGTERLRLSFSVAHSIPQITQALERIASLRS